MKLNKYAVAVLLLATPVFAQNAKKTLRYSPVRPLAAGHVKPALFYANYLTILPHLVDGGTYTSQIVVTNLGLSAEAYEVDFFSDTGASMNFSVANVGLTSFISGTLQPGQSVTYRTDGNTIGGPQADGWGATNTDVSGNDISIYQILTNEIPGQYVAEATTESTYGIAGTATAPGATINFDNTNGYSSGFAFTNPDAANTETGGSDIVDAYVYNSSGVQIGYHQITVGPGQKLLSVIQYDWPETAGVSGSILLYPDNNSFTPITPLAFRFLIRPSGTLTFTTLPLLILNQ